MADYAFRTLEDRRKIEKLWEDGRTPKEISETTGVSVYVVYAEDLQLLFPPIAGKI